MFQFQILPIIIFNFLFNFYFSFLKLKKLIKYFEKKKLKHIELLIEIHGENSLPLCTHIRHFLGNLATQVRSQPSPMFFFSWEKLCFFHIKFYQVYSVLTILHSYLNINGNDQYRGNKSKGKYVKYVVEGRDSQKVLSL